MKRLPGGIFWSLIIVTLFSACASEPTEEVAAAEAAMVAAKQAEADVYVADTYNDASAKLSSARREIADSSYDRARQLLAGARTGFEEATAGVEAARDEARRQAEAAQSEATQVLAEAEEALGKAPRGKGSRADLQTLKSDIDAARAAFATAEQGLASGSLAAARQGFQDAAARARAVIAAIPS